MPCECSSGFGPGRYVIDEFVVTAAAGLERPLMSRYRGTDYALI